MNFNEYIPNGGWLKHNKRIKRFVVLKAVLAYTVCFTVMALVMTLVVIFVMR